MRMEPSATQNPPNLAILSTQKTAPVHGFHCLYTYDLRRKAKRWQDGALRFHTFNKRIMVYDISRNFIGDTHWRDGGVIEDGDELELDKGVLIQVGERTESVNQDLTSLFEKRGRIQTHPAENVSSPRPDMAPIEKPGLSPPSQLRPKSLNAILGTPSGSLGRAAMPLKSPCELRLQNENDTGIRTGAKRRRIDRPSEIASAIRASHSERTTEPEMAKFAGERDSARKVPAATARTTRRLQPTTTIANPTTLQVEEGHVGDASTLTGPCHGPKQSLDKKRPKQAAAISTSLEKPRDLQSQDAPPRNQLQIISRKPRRKLMYQDLPSILPPNILSELPLGNTNTNNPRKQSKTRDPQAEFHQAQREHLESRLRRHNNKRRENNSPHHDGNSVSVIISDDDEDDTNILHSISHPNATNSKNPSSVPTSEPSLFLENESQSNSLPRRGWDPPPSPTTKIPKEDNNTSTSNHDLSQMDQILLTRPTSKIPPPPPSILKLPNNPLAPISKPHKRSPMRKTVSEPLGSTRLPACGTVDVAAPNPWSREAWDLFGYGRPVRGGKG